MLIYTRMEDYYEKEDEKTNLFVIDLYYGSNRMYI